MGNGGCEDEHDALGDQPQLHEAMVGVEFSSHGVAVGGALAVQMLVAGISFDGGHGPHPEVVEKGADNAQCALEGHLDLESIAVEANDLDGIERQIGAHEQPASACGVLDGDESDELAHGTPEQVRDAQSQLNIALAIDGAACGLHGFGLVEQGLEGDFPSIQAGPSPFSFLGLRGAVVGHGIGARTGHEMRALAEQGQDDLARGVVGVGHEVEGVLELQGAKQFDHLVEKRALVTV